ncbi:hypothetical protein MMC21_002879 [Puttea exsequens]|nr:hypothetical protein [Puttea exsequens]
MCLSIWKFAGQYGDTALCTLPCRMRIVVEEGDQVCRECEGEGSEPGSDGGVAVGDRVVAGDGGDKGRHMGRTLGEEWERSRRVKYQEPPPLRKEDVERIERWAMGVVRAGLEGGLESWVEEAKEERMKVYTETRIERYEMEEKVGEVGRSPDWQQWVRGNKGREEGRDGSSGKGSSGKGNSGREGSGKGSGRGGRYFRRFLDGIRVRAGKRVGADKEGRVQSFGT